FVIVLLILIFFGPKKIPEIARALGKGINEIKKVQKDINTEINRYSDEIDNPVNKVKEDIEGFSKGLNKAAEINPSESNNVNSETKEKPDDDHQTQPGEELPYPYNQISDEEPDESDSEEKDNQTDKEK
ncbi:MAG: twin-arginine translocase TatA/TatE family subunit, partial [Bacteroidales bacterium]